jgi:hypothetical protein
MSDSPSSAHGLSETPWIKARPLLLKWLERSRTNQLQHYKAAAYYNLANNALGIPVVVLSTIVGTAVFASLEKQVGLRTQLCVGGISILAAVLAALQTFLRYSERAEKHHSVAASYGTLRKQIEAIGFLPVESRGGIKELIDSLRVQFDFLAQSAPNPPESTWAALRRTKGQAYFVPEWPEGDAESDETIIGRAVITERGFSGQAGSVFEVTEFAKSSAPSPPNDPYRDL